MSQASPKDPELTETHLQILLNEAERMQSLYLDARNSVQNVFNFYLTFVTAVVGGLVFILQLNESLSPLRVNIMLIGLLFFAVLVGSVYMGALSVRYALSSRYAVLLDALRYEIFTRTQTPLPAVYASFTQASSPSSSQKTAWHLWLIPTGTYQMFMALTNAVSLALIVWLVGDLGQATFAANFWGSFFIFLLTMTIFNVYSRLTIVRFAKTVAANIDIGNQMQLWAARQ